jgi:nitroreductase
MNFDDAVRNRRSVRGFLPAPLSAQTLQAVFELAQHAPSGCNVQPWMPHVVSGQALMKLARALHEAGAARTAPKPDWPIDGKYFGIYRERQHGAAASLYKAIGVERNDLQGRTKAALRNLEFFDAPHAAFIFLQHPFGTREAADAGMYAQTLMLALTARGVASCAQGALSLYPDIVRSHLSLPDDHKLLFGVSFGYEDPAAKANVVRVGRIPVHEAVKFHE